MGCRERLHPVHGHPQAGRAGASGVEEAMTRRRPDGKSKVPNGVFARMLLADANDYFAAAETVIDSCGPDAPIYFMLSHSLELGLKAYLVAKVGIEYEAMVDMGHNLKEAYDRAVDAGLDANIEHANSLVQMLSDFHEDCIFRYPSITREGRVTMRGQLVRAEDVRDVIRKIIDKISGPVVLARVQAAAEGEYPGPLLAYGRCTVLNLAALVGVHLWARRITAR
jgi:hypothetical protein